MNIDRLREWVGKTEQRTDQIVLPPMAALAATLGQRKPDPKAGDILPHLWHWLYFLPTTDRGDIDTDGHPKRGGFLPPVPLSRRMWAAGKLEFARPLHAAEQVSRRSVILDVALKEGWSGPLIFVRVLHEISGDAGLAIREEQQIVYRDGKDAGSRQHAPRLAREDHAWSCEVIPDEVLLFRYSALTFNSHRIHYDLPYASGIEAYPGLVVQGPLTATLLMGLLQQSLPDAGVADFTFRAVKPLFCSVPFLVCGRREDGKAVGLWARTLDGELAMEATATLK